MLDEHLRLAFENGLAGATVFSWTDEWHTGGHDINDWSFGLCDRERRPKRAMEVVRRVFTQAPQCHALDKWPLVSVVVASYNGAATLRECLQSLTRMDYPNYEVILIDDGSTDNTREIALQFPSVRLEQQSNQGLSAARNQGIRLARGKIVAFVDSDCYVDRDWLHHLVAEMVSGGYDGMGGPNLTPAEDSLEKRAVGLAPGHAAHVLLDADHAEHVPGCNMAFLRIRLLEIIGFNPVYRKAGDDVDAIWRLQDRGYRIGFSTGAFVWHHRRSSIRAYLRQQIGYGEAEALLVWHHPHRFNDRGESLWRGVIYSTRETSSLFRTPDVHYGVFGSAGYQCLYQRPAGMLSYLVTSLEWYLLCLVLLPAGLLSPLALGAGLAGLAAAISVSGVRAWHRFREQERPLPLFPLVWLLWTLQPPVRGAARLWFRWRSPLARKQPESRPPEQIADHGKRLANRLDYWGEQATDRLGALRRFCEALGQRHWLYLPNNGWQPWDLTVLLTSWFKARLVTAEEDHGAGRRLLRTRWRMVPSSLAVVAALAALLPMMLVGLYDSVLARVLLIGLLGMGWHAYARARRRLAPVKDLLHEVLKQEGYFRMGRRREGVAPRADLPVETGQQAAES